MRTLARNRSDYVAIACALVCMVSFAGTATAACFSHTFEACRTERSESFTVEVDPMTGRTWLKKVRRKDEKLAKFAETAADNFSRRALVKETPNNATSTPVVSSWRARIAPAPTVANVELRRSD